VLCVFCHAGTEMSLHAPKGLQEWQQLKAVPGSSHKCNSSWQRADEETKRKDQQQGNSRVAATRIVTSKAKTSEAAACAWTHCNEAREPSHVILPSSWRTHLLQYLQLQQASLLVAAPSSKHVHLLHLCLTLHWCHLSTCCLMGTVGCHITDANDSPSTPRPCCWLRCTAVGADVLLGVRRCTAGCAEQ